MYFAHFVCVYTHLFKFLVLLLLWEIFLSVLRMRARFILFYYFLFVVKVCVYGYLNTGQKVWTIRASVFSLSNIFSFSCFFLFFFFFFFCLCFNLIFPSHYYFLLFYCFVFTISSFFSSISVSTFFSNDGLFFCLSLPLLSFFLPPFSSITIFYFL